MLNAVRQCFLNRGEGDQRPPYDGRGEMRFAAIACLLWFSASFIRLSLNGESWSSLEKCIESGSFVVFAGLPIFGLATPPGEQFARRWLLKQNGLGFQMLVCFPLLVYLAILKSLAPHLDQFRLLDQLNNLIFAEHFWLNTSLLLIGIFAALRVPFLALNWRISPTGFIRKRPGPAQKLQLVAFTGLYLGYLLLANTATFVSRLNTNAVSAPVLESALKTGNSGYAIAAAYLFTLLLLLLPITQGQGPGPDQKNAPQRFMVFDFLLTALCIYSIFGMTRPMFRFGPFIPVALFIVVVIYGIGLGREHFGYSFQMRWTDVVYTVKMIAIALILLVPTAFVLGFVNPKLAESITAAGGLGLFLVRLISFAVLFSFRVGVFEEMLFRAGLLVFIRDQLQGHGNAGGNGWAKQLGDRKTLLFTAALLCSLIFGIAHIGNSPSAGNLLAPWQYKAAYLILATAASMFYSLAYVETNRLCSSIVIHGFVDTTAVLLLGAELVVPF